jgi:thioredoxin-like negative regulator of GroEL
MPCRLVAPVPDRIAEEQAGRLLVAELNVDDKPATAET